MLDLLKKRRSIRKYKSDPVEPEKIDTLIKCALLSPSSRSLMPWEFIVVTDKATLAKLGQIANTGAFIKDAAACIVLYCRDTKYYLEDGSAATENMLIAAADMGLGCCWVAGDKKPYISEVSKLLGVPEGYKLISLIQVGWSLKETTQAKKRTLKEVLHREKWERRDYKGK